jgi:hypothetical protein
MKQVKNCKVCGCEFEKAVNCSVLAWSTREFCSRKCINTGRVGWLRGKKRPYDSPGSFKKGHEPWNKGSEWEGMKGEGNPLWKGDGATMTAQHNWIKRRLGRPKLCQKCGTTEDRMYHWANISHEYKRDVNDYVRLCVPCHKAYDLGRTDKAELENYKLSLSVPYPLRSEE